MARVGEQLRRYREAKGWTQDELGRRLNVTKITVSRYESGERQLQADTLPEVAEVLGIHPARFFLDEEERILPAPRTPGAERMMRDFLGRQGYTAEETDDLLAWLDWRRWLRAQGA